MNIHKITSAQSLKSTLSAANTYFIVENDITLEAGNYALGSGSIIEFSGGSFRGTNNTTLDLSAGLIKAGAYPIFPGLKVTGFHGCDVRAEWFKTKDVDEQDYINEALVAAAGCPVVLEGRTYELTGPIVFPKLPGVTPSSLISPGVLKLKGEKNNSDPVAIDISVSYVKLKVNVIEGIGEWKYIDKKNGILYTGYDFGGTGIRISQSSLQVDVDVYSLKCLHRGIVIVPGTGEISSYLQYLNINFQAIVADCGIYIDIYSNGKATLSGNTMWPNVWFSRSNIYGGRLSGYHGLYFAKPGDKDMSVAVESTASAVSYSHSNITGLRFINIGFEELHGIPIRLFGVSYVEFVRIRMAESLLYPTWISFENVHWIRMSITGIIKTAHYEVIDPCENIVINGVLSERVDWNRDSFDTVVIDSLGTGANRAPQIVVTNSVNPYQMTKTITTSDSLEGLSLEGLFPMVDNTYEDMNTKFHVLPRSVVFNITSTTIINLTGLRRFAPCIFYFYLGGTCLKTPDGGIGKAAARLLLVSDDADTNYMPTVFTTVANPKDRDLKDSVLLTECGLYRLVWDVSLETEYDAIDKDGKLVHTAFTRWVAYVSKIA